MNLSAIKKTEIIRELSFIPDESLDRIMTYIESVINELNLPAKNSRSLKGIWKDKGFEKIADLETEIKEARKILGNSILGKEL